MGLSDVGMTDGGDTGGHAVGSHKLSLPSRLRSMALLGGSSGVVNSLDFYPASLKSLDCF